MTPAVVLFDLDGTLVDTAPDIARALGAAMEGTGARPLALETVKRMVGDGARELIRRALAASPSDAAGEEAVFGRFLASYRENVCVASQLYPGVVEGLAALRADGAALAVVTNKPGDLARTLLAALGIGTSFDAIIGDGDGFPRKPDPAAALSVLAKVGASPDRAVVVGDGLPDVRLAHALGATAVAATWGYVPVAALADERPTFLAGSFQEALSIIRGAPLG
ncbi:MAG TPA: HAD-IA family hydrolase [Polyangia bacterium]|nr:HAD-IA family hydrolase [Polyangia bacterium]